MRLYLFPLLLVLTCSLIPAQIGQCEAVYPKRYIQKRQIQEYKQQQPAPPKAVRRAVQFSAISVYLSLAAGSMLALFIFFDILLLLFLPLTILMATLSSMFIMLATISLMSTAPKNFKTYNEQAAAFILLFFLSRLVIIGVAWYIGGIFWGILLFVTLLPVLIIYLIGIMTGLKNHRDKAEEEELLNAEN